MGLLKNLGRVMLGERRYVRLARMVRPRAEMDAYGVRAICNGVEQGAAVIEEKVSAGRPAAIGKIGALELRACIAVDRLSESGRFPKGLLEELHATAGIFPPDGEIVVKFSELYRASIQEVDVLAVWFLEGEQEFVERNVPRASLIRLLHLEPYASDLEPWSTQLAGKRVVVVSPFARSIENQYARRTEVWRARPEILPGFKLRTVRAPLSDYLVKSPFPDWFAALDALKRELAAEPFDVAIIGAGAFSIPLAVEAKRLGGIGIHLGGATQLLFGILGGRWEGSDYLRPFVNESWVRPTGDERPPGIKRVEGSAYW